MQPVAPQISVLSHYAARLGFIGEFANPLASSQLPLPHRMIAGVDPMDLKDILCQIYTNSTNLHCVILSIHLNWWFITSLAHRCR